MSFMIQQKTTKNITNDSNHPFYGVQGRVLEGFEEKFLRPLEATRTVQEFLHKHKCIECGKCCGHQFSKMPVYPDDELFTIRLRKDGKALVDDDKQNRHFFLFDGPEGCQYLVNKFCTAYIDRPSVCRTFPFDLKKPQPLRDLDVAPAAVISTNCPAVLEMYLLGGLIMVTLSDLIFPIEDALSNPIKYANSNRVEEFTRELDKLKNSGDKYYISPILGASIIAYLDSYKRGNFSRNDSPFIIHNDEVCIFVESNLF